MERISPSVLNADELRSHFGKGSAVLLAVVGIIGSFTSTAEAAGYSTAAEPAPDYPILGVETSIGMQVNLAGLDKKAGTKDDKKPKPTTDNPILPSEDNSKTSTAIDMEDVFKHKDLPPNVVDLPPIPETQPSKSGYENSKLSAMYRKAARIAAQRNGWGVGKTTAIDQLLVYAPLVPASGIAGSNQAESSYNACVEEKLPAGETRTQKGYGLFQHTFERRDQLEAAAKAAGVNIFDCSSSNLTKNTAFQVNFSVSEAKIRKDRDTNNTIEWDEMLAMTDVRNAAAYWQWNHERPKQRSIQQSRVNEAYHVYDQVMAVISEDPEMMHEVLAAQPKIEMNINDFALTDPSQISYTKELINSGLFNGSQAISEKAPRTMIDDALKAAGYSNGQLPSSELASVGGDWAADSPVLQKEAAEAYNKMDAAFYAALGKHLEFMGSISDYRDLEGQKGVYKISRPGFAAEPGTSNHGWGLAADLKDWAWHDDKDKWLQANAWKYGFYKPFGLNEFGKAPEPWHVEYILKPTKAIGEPTTETPTEEPSQPNNPQQQPTNQQPDISIQAISPSGLEIWGRK